MKLDSRPEDIPLPSEVSVESSSFAAIAWFQQVPQIWLAIFGGVLVGLMVVVSAFFWWRTSNAGFISVENTFTEAPTPTPKPDEPSFTVVLVGYGGAGHDGSSLTDSILVARLLLEQKRVILLSVPRDLWVRVPGAAGGEKSMKINAAYALHGPDGLKQSLERVTGWKIDRYFGVDFRGFTQAIDSLGGVELTVERAFDDYEYPISGRERLVCDEEKDETGAVLATPEPVPADGATSVAEEISTGLLEGETLPENVKKYPCRYEHLKFAAGKQTLTGTQALKYARSRHSAQDGNDFNRARRQQNLILALVAQIFRTNSLTKIPSLLSTLRGNTSSDFTALEIAEWLTKASAVREYPMTSLVLTDKNYLAQGFSSDRQFVLQPLAGEFEWKQIQNWLRFITVPEEDLLFPVVEIQAPPNQRFLAEGTQSLVATGSAWPVRISTVSAPRSASASAVLVPLVPRINPVEMMSLSVSLGATIDTSQISTASSVLNGPHLKVIWR